MTSMKLQTKLKTMNSTIDILTDHLNRIKERIAEKMALNSRNASGRTVASLKVDVSETHAILWGSKAFLAMERGRGPGPIPMGFTDIIYAWAKAKGISAKAKSGSNSNPDMAMRSFAGAVAFNIMKHGTKLHRSKQHEDIFTSVLNEELEKMSDALVVNLLDEVSTINDNMQ